MAVTLAFHRIQLHFSRRIRDKCSIPNSPQSPDIGQNSDVGISDFRISGQFILKDNCHNSGSSYDIDIKLGPVTKLDKTNSAASMSMAAMVSCRQFVTSLLFF